MNHPVVPARPEHTISPGRLAGHGGFGACVLSFFDGMHAHHRQLLSEGLSRCGGDPGSLLVIMAYVDDDPGCPASGVSCLLTPSERLQMLLARGARHVLPWAFPRPHSAEPLMGWPAEPSLLAGKVPVFIPGADLWENPHFTSFLQEQKGDSGGPAGAVEDTFRGSGDRLWQQISKLIETGSVEQASAKLGYAYPLEGLVVEGNRIGRTLGYPTANLRVLSALKLLPMQGVYVGMARVEGSWHRGMINIGIRPTLDMANVTIEVHLFDYNQNIYGQPIALAFLQRIRHEMRFSSLGELRHQLDLDREKALEVFGELAPRLKINGDFVFLKVNG